MGGRRFEILPGGSVDGHFNFYYSKNGEERCLRACEIIGDQEMRIGIIESSVINPRRWLLRPADSEPITVTDNEDYSTRTLEYPGKSAFLRLESPPHQRHLVYELVRSILLGQPDRNDHLHLSTVGRLGQAGWLTFWAPLQMSSLATHVRLVAERTYSSGENPTEDDASNLVNAFQKVC